MNYEKSIPHEKYTASRGIVLYVSAMDFRKITLHNIQFCVILRKKRGWKTSLNSWKIAPSFVYLNYLSSSTINRLPSTVIWMLIYPAAYCLIRSNASSKREQISTRQVKMGKSTHILSKITTHTGIHQYLYPTTTSDQVTIIYNPDR